MRPIQSNSRSDSIGKAFIEDRGFGDDHQDTSKILIRKANRTNINHLFDALNIKVDEYMKKCHCPFPYHQKDRTPSFQFYKDTNSFFCFGCKTGGGPVELLSSLKGIPKEDAAQLILSKFGVNDPLADISHNFQVKQQLLLEFSSLIKNFITDNLDDNLAIEYSERVCLIFDTVNSKHKLDNQGLKFLIEKLTFKLHQRKNL